MKKLTKVHLFLLKKHVFSLIILFALTACSYAQKQKNPNTKNQPQVHINVNKQLDENGNVIRYDSTYSWSWTNIDKNVSDSVLNYFFPKSNLLWNNPLSVLDNDSLFFNQFSFPLLDDPFFDFDINHEMEQFLNKQHLLMLEQQEIIDKFMKSHIPLPKNNQEPEIKDNDSPDKNNKQKQGVDL